MTEAIILELIKCITIAFCVFTGSSVFLAIMKYAVNKSEEDKYLTVDEFEEYQHIVSDGLADNNKLIKEIMQKQQLFMDKIQEKK